MSVITTFPFDNPVNYSLSNTEVALGTGKLILVPFASQTFNQDFAASTSFTFDATKTEFVAGKVQQKDRTPANSLYGATYTTVKDLSWNKIGALTAVLVGVPTLSGGKLVCTGNQGLYYAYTTVALETYKFKYTPNYNTTPPADINIAGSFNGVDNKDRAVLGHLNTSSLIEVFIYDNGGIPKINTPFAGAWQPNAGQEYEFELNVNPATGFATLFIDGVLHDSKSAGGSFTRGGIASRFYVGSSPWDHDRAEGSFNDLLVFSNIQHTVGYTPGYTTDETIFGNDTIDLPDFVYGGLGEIQSLDSLVTTQVNGVRYTFEGQFWNGSAWAASDGSHAQANDKATANTNLPALDMTGQTIVSVQAIWPESNTASSVDDLTLGYSGEQFALEGTLLTNVAFVAQQLVSFSATEIAPANTSIKYILNVNGVDIYHNGTAWVVSDGTSTQANTLSEVQANLGTGVVDNATIKIKVVLISDGTDTPEIDIITVIYNFGALEPAQPQQCQVFGFLKDALNVPIENAVVKVKPNRTDKTYLEAGNRVIASELSFTTDDEGFFSFNLIVSSEFESLDSPSFQYALEIELPNQTNNVTELEPNEPIVFTVPDLPTANITSLIKAV